MVNYREILRLHSLGQSQRTIRSSAHCSDNTVRTVLEVASQKGIQWPLDDDITNADLERMLFPDKYKSACTLNRTIRTFTVSWQSMALLSRKNIK